MTRKYVKSGKPRKPYVRTKGLGPRKPARRQEYIDAFNATQSFKEAGKLFGVSGKAVQNYFERNGIEVVKLARAHSNGGEE